MDTPASRFNKELGEIRNLCTELANCHKKVCSIGFLNCGNGYRHEFYTSVPDSVGFSKRGLSLPGLLSPDNTRSDQQHQKERKICREDRKFLSVHISISLLQLYQTPWITGEWNGNEIIVKGLDERTQSSVVPQPYFRRPFAPTAATAKDTQAIVFRLGVLLLELCLGETLAKHSRDHQSHEPEWKMAYDCWEQNAKTEEGPEVAEAIRKCLDFDFQTASRSLENEDLRRAVYNEVIRPLNEALDKFRVD